VFQFGVYLAAATTLIALQEFLVLRRALRSATWKRAQGHILDSKPGVDILVPEGQLFRTPRVTYEYRVGEDIYAGTRIRYQRGWDLTKARIAVYRYHSGEKVVVFYDPQNPGRAVLEPGARTSNWLAFLGALLGVLVGVAIAFRSRAA
jgi:hypothetical protein